MKYGFLATMVIVAASAWPALGQTQTAKPAAKPDKK